MENLSTLTIGCDLGDRNSDLCVLDEAGDVVKTLRFSSTRNRFTKVFSAFPASRVVIEVGCHSPWVSRLLEAQGHQVIVANPRKVALIYQDVRKSDRTDAELLARLGRVDPQLLSPIQHRGEAMQRVRTLLRARAQLVQVRTQLITSVRSLVKSFSGERLPSCSAASFHNKAAESMTEALRPMLCPMVASIETLTTQVKVLDARIEYCSRVEYPEAMLLRQVSGVGPVTALAFVATLDDPHRFKRSRQVGAFLGLCPRRDQSGNSDKQLGISKCGDPYLRKLLVQCAHQILGRFRPDTDLRRWGLAKTEHGGKNAKKRTIVALARKLAVLLHALWVGQTEYVPIGYRQPTRRAA